MSKLAELTNSERRLQVLRLLAESNGYTAPVDVLHMVLREMRLGCSHDLMATELEWLKEQGLVLLSRIGEVASADLTVRGHDVATGLASVPGVARPKAGV